MHAHEELVRMSWPYTDHADWPQLDRCMRRTDWTVGLMKVSAAAGVRQFLVPDETTSTVTYKLFDCVSFDSIIAYSGSLFTDLNNKPWS